MADKDDMEYKLNVDNLDENIIPKDGSQWPKPAKIILILIVFICLALVAGLITFILLYKNKSSNSQKNQEQSEKQEPGKNPAKEETENIELYNFFGIKYPNLTYDDNGKIINTFKKGGDNYNESMGEINDGKDYEKNERNIYDLYIPQYALDRKNEVNGIILWIHGGSWMNGTKDDMDAFCKLYSQQGYISATLSYTLLNSPHKDFNIFKMLDEITACIKAIKKDLVKKGFAGDKLKLVIGGYSSGAHLTLLYSYLIKKFEIPIQFIINYVGPIGLDSKYFNVLTTNETLPNIEKVEYIEKALQEGKIRPMIPAPGILGLRNLFLGNKYNESDIKSMLYPNMTINENDAKYKEMFNVVKFSSVTEIEDLHKTPTICIYGGADEAVGVSVYAYLKQKADKDGRPLEFIYSRNERHMLIFPTTLDGMKKIWETGSLTMKYLKKYFEY